MTDPERPEESSEGPPTRTPFSAIGGSPEDNATAIEAFGAAIKTAGPDFGRGVKALEEAAATADPITVMGAMSMYIGSAEAGSNPEHDRPLGLFQHHLEMAQAALLRYGANPGLQPPALHIEPIASAVKDFNEAWIVLQAQKVENAQNSQRQLESTLAQLRIHSSTRRGWAYASRMAPMLEDLLSPLDPLFEERLGFAPGALPAWWKAIADRADERLDRHRHAVREAWDWPVDDRWEKRVAERFGSLATPGATDLWTRAAASDELRRGYVTQCSDLRAHEIYRFTLEELAELMPAPNEPDVVARIADAWSLRPGEDGGIEIGNLVPDNPVVGRPLVAGSGEWHIFCGWLFLHNPFGLLERLLEDDETCFTAYLDRRAKFLEERTAELFTDSLPAEVDRSLESTDPSDGKTYENDLLIRVSSYAVVAEAKGGRLHTATRRSRGRLLRDKINELLVRPSEQGMRLAERLVAESGEVEFQRKHDGESVLIDASEIRRAIAIGVTLEPVAEVLPRLTDVAAAGFSEREADALAYSISLPDLELVLDLLEHPSEVLHYLGRRTEIERSTFLIGDEVDLLALYLQTGFNFGEREFSGRDILDVTGLSDPIDVWHYRREAGLEAEKPTSDRTPWWESVLSKVEARAGPRWAEIGVTFCNFAPPEQVELEQAMQELRRSIVAGERPATDLLVFQNGPPQRRDVICGLIVTSPDAKARARQYQDALSVVLDKHDLDRLIILAWTPRQSPDPYFALAVYDSEAADLPPQSSTTSAS